MGSSSVPSFSVSCVCAALLLSIGLHLLSKANTTGMRHSVHSPLRTVHNPLLAARLPLHPSRAEPAPEGGHPTSPDSVPSDDLEAGPPLGPDEQGDVADATRGIFATVSEYIARWREGLRTAPDEAGRFFTGRWQQLREEGFTLVSAMRDKGAVLLQNVTQSDFQSTWMAFQQSCFSLANHLTEAYNENPELKEALRPVYNKAMEAFRDLGKSLESGKRSLGERARNAGTAFQSSQRLAAATQQVDRAKQRIESVWHRPDPLPKRLFGVGVIVAAVLTTLLLSMVAFLSGMLQRVLGYVVDWLGVPAGSPSERSKIQDRQCQRDRFCTLAGEALSARDPLEAGEANTPPSTAIAMS
eukprot:GGOE01003798.1.p1 GENE.GGOE01003798.1~~GGOE01003798.1.p1  ORF type:complete len:356 (-),score=53.43 GGOE01003798.1:352-1419(-)